MTTDERIAEIKCCAEEGESPELRDTIFLLAEVERLRTALKQLKWADDNLREVTDVIYSDRMQTFKK